MSKGIKKILVILLALTMLFSTASFAWAEDGVRYSDAVQEEADTEFGSDSYVQDGENQDLHVQEDIEGPVEGVVDVSTEEPIEKVVDSDPIDVSKVTEENTQENIAQEDQSASTEEYDIIEDIAEQLLPFDQTIEEVKGSTSVKKSNEPNMEKSITDSVAQSDVIGSGTCGADGDNLTWALTSDGILTISGFGQMEDYTTTTNIPWYSQKDSITEVVISEGVTHIGNTAFCNIGNITSITIPESVTSIGLNVFYKCNSLNKVYINDISKFIQISYGNSDSHPTVYSSGADLYINGELVTIITIPEGITNIAECAFINFSSITSITIPDSVTSIGNSAFNNCSSLSSITIPDSVTSIGNSAFYKCSSLNKIYINDISKYVQINYGNAFSHPSHSSNGTDIYINEVLTTNISIPEGTTNISDYAFSKCTSLTSISIPESVTSIGKCVFYECSNLTNITIPDSVTSIADNAFYKCSSLTNITIPGDVISIGTNAFRGCNSLTSITLPESVTNIGDCVFYECSNLTNITIPNSVTSIADYAFYKCSSLTSISIPESVVSIGRYAFYGCSLLASIYIPSSVTVIGFNAFYNCNVLNKVYIDDIISFIQIDYDGYGDNNPTCNGANLYINGELTTNIEIPEGVTEIKKYAFYGCELTSITIPESITSIGASAFEECSKLYTVNIKDITHYLQIDFDNKYSNPAWKKASIYINGEYATILEIPEGVTEIKKHAFSGWSRLNNITIPDGVISIGEGAFCDCSGLRSITIPEGVTSIEKNVFKGCSNITSITIPYGVTSIGDYSFWGCYKLQSVMLSESVTSIGSNAFYSCEKLTTIGIPSGLKSIGEGNFYDWVNIKNIIFYGNNLDWDSISIGENNDSLASATKYEILVEDPNHIGTTFDPLISVKKGGKALIEDSDYVIQYISKATELGSSGIVNISFSGTYADLPTVYYHYTIPDHDLVKIESNPSTCLEKGNITYWTCTMCGKLFSDAEGKIEITEEDTIVDPTGHTWNEGEILIAPTCTEEGLKKYTCINCGVTKEEFISTIDHTWDDGIVTKEPTFVDDGVKKYTCIICGDEKNEPIPALGYPDGETIAWSDIDTHSEIAFDKLRKKIINEYNGTYTSYFTNNDSYSIYVSVSVINQNLFFRYVFEQKTNLRELNSVEFTLSSNGYLRAIKFTDNFREVSDGAATGYLYESADTFKTDSSSYNYGFSITKGNGYKLSDADANSAANTTLRSALMHLDLNLSTDFDTRLCDIYFHNYGDWEEIHHVTTNAIDPTCTEVGYTGITYCTICGSVKKYSTSIPPTGHHWDSGVITKEATIDEAGTRIFTCTVCGKTKEEEIPATGGHTWDEGVITINPSCTKEGVKIYTCTTCGETIKLTIPANGHNWDHGRVTQSPTSANDGIKTYTCSTCGEVKNESIPASGYPDECTDIYWDDIDSHCAVAFDKLRKKIINNYDGTYLKYFTNNDSLSIYVTVYPVNDKLLFRYTNVQKTGLRELIKIEFTLSRNGELEPIRFSDNFTEVSNAEASGYLYASTTSFNTNSSSYNYDFSITRDYGYKLSVADANDLANSTLKSALMHLDLNLSKDFDTRLCDIYFYYYGKWNDIHHVTTTGAFDPTCTEAGNTGITYCTICGSVEKDSESIPPTGHDWGSGVITKKATCKETGTKEFTCSACGEIREEVIPATGHNFKTTTTKATLTKNGSIVTKCATCGEVKSSKTIYYPKTIKLSATSYTYDGKVKTPTVTVKDSKGNTISSTNYTVTKATGRKNVGSYKYTIKFKGNYSGTKTLTFKINPKGTTLKTLTATSKGFKATWTKQAIKMSTSYITGYEIQYSTSPSFASGNKTVVATKYSTVSKTISKLTAKKKYYVRIRTYKTVSGVKYYSPWSAKKYVTTKA